LVEQKKVGKLLEESAQKRLGAGTAKPTSPARVFVFHISDED